MNARCTRIGYLAGRELPVHEISRQVDCHHAQITAILKSAGIAVPAGNGPVLIVSVPISGIIEAIDAVGRKLKMSREDIAAKVLLAKLSSEEEITDILERAGHA